MSILIATPCFGSQVTLPYHQSIIKLVQEFERVGMKYDFLHTGNESLITRARNTSVSTFLKTDYEKLLFIDADIQFEPQDVASLWNLQTDYKVTCGAYPLKTKVGLKTVAWKNGEQFLLEDFQGPTPIDYAGTGFLMIDREVLEAVKEHVIDTEHEEGVVGRCWLIFDRMIKDDVCLSEDYTFCQYCRDLGYEVILDPSIKLKHFGNYLYGE